MAVANSNGLTVDLNENWRFCDWCDMWHCYILIVNVWIHAAFSHLYWLCIKQNPKMSVTVFVLWRDICLRFHRCPSCRSSSCPFFPSDVALSMVDVGQSVWIKMLFYNGFMAFRTHGPLLGRQTRLCANDQTSQLSSQRNSIKCLGP